MRRIVDKLISSRKPGRVVLGLVVASWGWKILEIAGRQSGVLRRNLGWGYYVTLDAPILLTFAACFLWVVKKAIIRSRRLHE